MIAIAKQQQGRQYRCHPAQCASLRGWVLPELQVQVDGIQVAQGFLAHSLTAHSDVTVQIVTRTGTFSLH